MLLFVLLKPPNIPSHKPEDASRVTGKYMITVCELFGLRVLIYLKKDSWPSKKTTKWKS